MKREVLSWGNIRYWLSLAFPFLIPLKLSLAYIVLIPLLLGWLFEVFSPCFTKEGGILSGIKRLPRKAVEVLHQYPLARPLFLFTAVAGVSALFGLAPLHSLTRLLGFAFFAITLPVYIERMQACGPLPFFILLVIGQAISSLDSVGRLVFGERFPRLFLGAVTESGQMAMTSILAIGLTLVLWNERVERDPPTSREHSASAHRTFLWLLLAVIPGILLGFIENLKRGPWVGAFCGLLILLLRFERRLVLPLIAATCAVIIAIPHVQERIQESSQHFYISGGRNEIWQIGVELASRFPIGIGYRNSPVLRQFSEEIPPELRHFHNNFLNLIVENGWIASVFLFWWMILIIQKAFQRNKNQREAILAATIGCAFIAWQIAGLVEYNLGDSEVVLVAYLLVSGLTTVQVRHPKMLKGCDSYE